MDNQLIPEEVEMEIMEQKMLNLITDDEELEGLQEEERFMAGDESGAASLQAPAPQNQLQEGARARTPRAHAQQAARAPAAEPSARALTAEPAAVTVNRQGGPLRIKRRGVRGGVLKDS